MDVSMVCCYVGGAEDVGVAVLGCKLVDGPREIAFKIHSSTYYAPNLHA